MSGKEDTNRAQGETGAKSILAKALCFNRLSE